MEHLAALMAFFRQHALAAGLEPKRIHEGEVAVEEALVNIFHYAYPGGAGEVKMVCTEEVKGSLVVEIADKGVPFDALEAPEPDLSQGLAERRIGGLGILFLKRLADDARYRRERGWNVLTLAFHSCPTPSDS